MNWKQELLCVIVIVLLAEFTSEFFANHAFAIIISGAIIARAVMFFNQRKRTR